MSNNIKKTSTILFKQFALVFTIYAHISYVLSCSNQYDEDFTYSFDKTQIRFPLTVGQAISKHKVLPHQYNRTGVAFTSPCPPGVPTNGISEIYYVDRADDYFKSPTDSLSRNVYAIKFCFTQQNTHSFQKIKSQLEDDFKRQFELKYNSDSNEPYYQLSASNDVSILIEFYPEFVYVFDKKKIENPQSWAVSFCYKLGRSSIRDYTKYERDYDAQ